MLPPFTFLCFIFLTDEAISSLRGNHAQLMLSPDAIVLRTCVPN